MRAAMVLAALALITAGCGGDSTTESTEPSTPPTEAPSASSPAPAETPDAADQVEQAWPGAVGYHEAIYHGPTDTVLMFGGWSDADENDRLWGLDPLHSTWADLGPVPAEAADGVPAYDTESDAAVVLEVAFEEVATAPLGTWVFDRESDAWTEIDADPHPRLGVGARMVYDSESDRVIAFGGVGLDEDGLVWTEGTWAFDANTGTWMDMQPAVAPPPINFYAFSYDAESDRAVLFGLKLGGESLLWTYDHNTNTWEELERTGGPELAPAYGRSFYHPSTDRIIHVGGTGSPETNPDALDLVWAYDLNTNTWEDLGPAGVTGPIAWHTLTYVDSIDRALVFGGGPTYDEYYSDRLFAYDPAENEWSQVGIE